VWSGWQQRGPFEPGSPWLLRFFDRIRWYPVGAEELLEMRADMAAGRLPLRIEEGEFALADHLRFLDDNAADIAAFRETQGAAFAAERDAWEQAGEFDRAEQAVVAAPPAEAVSVAEGGALVAAEFTACVWKVDVEPGQRVTRGQRLLAVEAMKMESILTAPQDGIVERLLVRAGDQVEAGAPLLLLAPPTPAPGTTDITDTVNTTDTTEAEDAA